MSNKKKYKESYALSDRDINHMLVGQCPIFDYQQIEQIDDLRPYLDVYKGIVILYEWKPNVGHWVCLFRTKQGRVEFFDSLGYAPDSQISFAPNEWRDKLYNDYRYLSKLLADLDENVDYNQYALQQDVPGIATCGRHVVCRLLCQDMSISQYQKLMIDFGNPDELVTELTNELYQ